FPSSLMIGCYAEARDDQLTIDHTELEEADWFTRDEVAAAMCGDEDARFIAPPPQAIAHHLLKWWLER
ncbi:MAG: NADH pyrophosphatase, partial [Novosphingobium sp.]